MQNAYARPGFTWMKHGWLCLMQICILKAYMKEKMEPDKPACALVSLRKFLLFAFHR